MSVGQKVLHLLERSRKAQKERDCAGAFYALIQAARAYGYAAGAEQLEPPEAAFLSNKVRDRANEVFDGCIGED